MVKHGVYRKFPAAEVKNLGNLKRHFEQLGVYCAMTFDKKGAAATILYSIGDGDSIFVWSERKEKELDLAATAIGCSIISVGNMI